MPTDPVTNFQQLNSLATSSSTRSPTVEPTKQHVEVGIPTPPASRELSQLQNDLEYLKVSIGISEATMGVGNAPEYLYARRAATLGADTIL